MSSLGQGSSNRNQFKLFRYIYIDNVNINSNIIRSNIEALSVSCLKDTVPEDFEIGPQKVLSSFKPLTEAAICKLIQSSAKKSCALDPMPTPLVVSCLDVLLPVITTIVNSSLLRGHFPSNWKEAIVTPILKNPSLTSEFSNLRPISNLQFISKLTERAVFDQLQTHVLDHALYPLLQSAYRKSHSTETALITVQNDILMNMDCEQVTLLVLLDLSAAFDPIDHQVLLNRLRFCHITPTLFSLHWLPVCFRIEFKLLILAFKAIHGLAPQYITDLINVKQQFGRMMLRSQSELQLLPPRTITKKTLGLWHLLLNFGADCHQI